MILMTLPELAAVVGGTVVHDSGATVTGPAFVDSRIAERGGLFVAVVGERVDGHDYADAAVDAGAAAVLSTRDTGHPTSTGTYAAPAFHTPRIPTTTSTDRPNANPTTDPTPTPNDPR